MSKATQNKINLFPILNLTILGIIFLIIALVLFNFQGLKDNFTIWANPTSSSTLDLVQTAGMNSRGEFYYKASTPTLADASTFNEVCRANRERSDAILGCYTNQQIYIYDITDERLNGVREVTAVHESLHAIYDRLSAGEKSYVNGLLGVEYAKMSGNLELKERMDYYERTEPGQFYNELHSIIGTEKKEVTRSLEDYYSKYFSNRLKVVNLHLNYVENVRILADNARRLSEEISTHKAQLEVKIDKYNKDAANMNYLVTTFNKNAATVGYFKTQSDFLQARQQLAAQMVSLDLDHNLIQAEIKHHDDLVKDYNAVTFQINDINKSLNSALAPKPTL